MRAACVRLSQVLLLCAACADSNLDSMEARDSFVPDPVAVSTSKQPELPDPVSTAIPLPSAPRAARHADAQSGNAEPESCTQARSKTTALTFGDGDWLRVGQGGMSLARNAQGELFSGNEVVRKYRADGSQLWCARVPGNITWVLVALDDGGVLAAGERATTCTRPNSTCYHDFVTRLDADGGEVWSRTLSDPENVSRVTGMAHADGLIYLAGQTSGGLSFAGETRTRAQSDLDFFVLAIDEDATELKWAEVFGSTSDDGDGPVLAAHPEAGVIAAGHTVPSGFIRAYTPAGEVSWENTLRGRVSLFELSVDGRGQIWTAGVMRETLALDQARSLQQTRGDFAAMLLEYAPDGTLVSSQVFETPTTGGVRVLGLAPRTAGVFLISDYGYPTDSSKLGSVTVRFAAVDAAGQYAEFDAFEMLSTFSRHPAVTADDSSIVWTGANVRATSFGLDQGQFPNGSFLMQRSLPQ